MLVIEMLVGLAVLFSGVVAATGRGGGLAPAPPTDVAVVGGWLRPGDLSRVRFGVALRGYRMTEVDTLLDRLAAELATRDAELATRDAELATRDAELAALRARRARRLGPPGDETTTRPRPVEARMAELSLFVDVAAPVEATWRAAVDWERQGEWILATRVRPVTGDDGRGVGARVVAVTGVGPLAVTDPFVVTGWDPPNRCLVRHDGRVVRGAGAFEVEARPGGGSRFVWTEWLELPFGRLGQVGWELARPVVTLGLRWSLRRFATLVESGR